MTMIERVARALSQPCADAQWAEMWAWHTSPEAVTQGGEWSVITRARAAIKAMRDPSHLMLQRFVDQRLGLAMWQAGIDAALHDPTDKTQA